MDDTAPQMLNFDSLEPVAIPVKIQGKRYFLVEASSEAAKKWRNQQFVGTKITHSGSSDKRTIQLGNMADSQELLVSYCLIMAKDDGSEHGALPKQKNGDIDYSYRVKPEQIRSWPNRVTERLFEEAKKISGLIEIETEEQLVNQIDRLKKRLDKLRKAKAKDSSLDSEEDLAAKN